MSLETKHAERFCLYQMMLVLNGKQSVKRAISAIRAVMEPEDVKLVEKEIMDLLNDKEDE